MPRDCCAVCAHTWLNGCVDLRLRVLCAQVEVRETGICELDLFVGRTSNQDVERRLCQRCERASMAHRRMRLTRLRCRRPRRLRRAIERPLEVGVTGKGIDAVTTELCVAAPMDAGGHARPRVLLGAQPAGMRVAWHRLKRVRLARRTQT